MEQEVRRYTKRQRIGVLLYRDGPSSFADEKALVSEREVESNAPKGLNENMSHDLKNDEFHAGSEVLMIYFSKIGVSEIENTLEVDLIETLLKSGADVNFQDIHGQTVVHEVALRWPTGLATFFLGYGAHIDHADKFGRTPLHVAASVNAPDMVKWLIVNGADIHAHTLEENQTPIHYAAKNNAVDVLPILLELGSSLHDRDYKERTPLLLAAETGREDAARVLLQRNAPAGVYDDTGTSCLTYLIETMPDVAAMAMEQFYYVDKATRTTYYYLAYLESQKWENMRSGGMRVQMKLEPLEQIIKCRDKRLIMHPVMQRLLTTKRQLYGTRQFYTQLYINFLFTLIWTLLTISTPKPRHYEYGHTDHNDIGRMLYQKIDENLWRIILEIIGLLMALYFIIKMHLDSSSILRNFQQYKLTRICETVRDYQYCHPRWPHEHNYVTERADTYRDQSPASLYDSWYYLDTASFLGLCVVTVSRVAVVILGGGTNEAVHFILYGITLVIIWLRLMKYFRPFITLGPFINMLGYVVHDTLKFAFLFCQFFIPFVCAIWIIFGGPDSGKHFRIFNDTMWEVFRMTLVDSFNYSQLTEINKLAAQLICGTYFAIVSITCFNLYIALLSSTFSNVLMNATATAYMLQAEVLIGCEKKMTYATNQKLRDYIATNCSPEIVQEESSCDNEENNAIREIKSEINALRRKVEVVRKRQISMRPKIKFIYDEVRNIVRQQEEFNAGIEAGLRKFEEEEEDVHESILAKLLFRKEEEGEEASANENSQLVPSFFFQNIGL